MIEKVYFFFFAKINIELLNDSKKKKGKKYKKFLYIFIIEI